ncbi:unnamed protein product, partial [Prorocentrum cordatum]
MRGGPVAELAETVDIRAQGVATISGGEEMQEAKIADAEEVDGGIAKGFEGARRRPDGSRWRHYPAGLGLQLRPGAGGPGPQVGAAAPYWKEGGKLAAFGDADALKLLWAQIATDPDACKYVTKVAAVGVDPKKLAKHQVSLNTTRQLASRLTPAEALRQIAEERESTWKPGDAQGRWVVGTSGKFRAMLRHAAAALAQSGDPPDFAVARFCDQRQTCIATWAIDNFEWEVPCEHGEGDRKKAHPREIMRVSKGEETLWLSSVSNSVKAEAWLVIWSHSKHHTTKKNMKQFVQLRSYKGEAAAIELLKMMLTSHSLQEIEDAKREWLKNNHKDQVALKCPAASSKKPAVAANTETPKADGAEPEADDPNEDEVPNEVEDGDKDMHELDAGGGDSPAGEGAPEGPVVAADIAVAAEEGKALIAERDSSKPKAKCAAKARAVATVKVAAAEAVLAGAVAAAADLGDKSATQQRQEDRKGSEPAAKKQKQLSAGTSNSRSSGYASQRAGAPEEQGIPDGQLPPLPLAVYVDGVRYQSHAAGRSDAVTGWWVVNLLSGRRWQLLHLQGGRRPATKWGGTARPEGTNTAALDFSAVLLYVKGDWCEHSRTLALGSWSQFHNCCQFCDSPRDDLIFDVDLTAGAAFLETIEHMEARRWASSSATELKRRGVPQAIRSPGDSEAMIRAANDIMWTHSSGHFANDAADRDSSTLRSALDSTSTTVSNRMKTSIATASGQTECRVFAQAAGAAVAAHNGHWCMVYTAECDVDDLNTEEGRTGYRVFVTEVAELFAMRIPSGTRRGSLYEAVLGLRCTALLLPVVVVAAEGSSFFGGGLAAAARGSRIACPARAMSLASAPAAVSPGTAEAPLRPEALAARCAFTTLPWDGGRGFATPGPYFGRLRADAARLGIAWPAEGLAARLRPALLDALDAAGRPDCAEAPAAEPPSLQPPGLLRVELGADGAVRCTLRALPPSAGGDAWQAVSRAAPRFGASATGTKHGDWDAYRDATSGARSVGAGVSLLVHRGDVVDCDRCTPLVLCADGRTVLHPARGAGAVHSVTAELVRPALAAAGLDLREGRVPLASLRDAEEVVVVGSGVGVRQISCVDGASLAGRGARLLQLAAAALRAAREGAWLGPGAVAEAADAAAASGPPGRGRWPAPAGDWFMPAVAEVLARGRLWGAGAEECGWPPDQLLLHSGGPAGDVAR